MLLSILCIASLFLAQQNTGALKGTVTDQLGSLVVGAKVTVRNSRGVVTSSTTNSSGIYEFRRLEPGTYELKVVSPGFSGPNSNVLSLEVSAPTGSEEPARLG